MDFSRKKLPREVSESLRRVPIHTVRPYALMMAPVYVFMKLNAKFVAVKSPLDFFTPAQLEQLAPFESLFMPDFVDYVLPFRDAAHSVRALLSWAPKQPVQKVSAKDAKTVKVKFPEVILPPAPYELSDAVLRTVAPLWARGQAGEPVMEPFFVAVFVNELCDPLPPQTLQAAHDADIAGFERALLRSSWAVFLALHLGYCNLGFLNRLRRRVFDETTDGPAAGQPGGEWDEIIFAARSTLETAGGRGYARVLGSETFTARRDRVSQKMASRLERVKSQFMSPDSIPPSIYGEKGFVDV